MKTILSKVKYLLRLIPFAAKAALYALHTRAVALIPARPRNLGRGRRAIVFISTHPFAGLWQRPQQVAVRLAKRYSVLYFWPLYASDLARGKMKEQPVPADTGRDLSLLSPVLLPFERASDAIYRANLGTVKLAVTALLRKMGVSDAPILWFYAPRFAPLLDRLPHSGIVYDIMDEHAAFRFARRDTKGLEARLLTSAQVVFAGTYTLMERKKALAPGVVYLPCGVEFEHFASAAEKGLPPPPELASAKGPVLGYFGAVDDRIDFDIVLAAAESHPDWTICLAGPWLSTRSLSEMKRHTNLILPGLVPYSELPKYLARFDVALLPFVLNDLTLHIHPTKALEYLASRTPVVSTPIPDVVRFYPGIIRIAADPKEFVAAVEETLLDKDRTAIDRGFQMAKESSWEGMVDKMRHALEKALSLPAEGADCE